MLSACNVKAPKMHAAVARALNDQVRRWLPHPFEMRLEWSEGEDYNALLPTLPHVRGREGGPSPLIEVFDGTRTHAQAVLLSYLGANTRRL